MKVTAKDNGINLEEVFCGVRFITEDGEVIGVCMRDSGYEITYYNSIIELKNGIIKIINIDNTHSTIPSDNADIKNK